MARNRSRKKLLEENPFCIYCGGVNRANEEDHIPPRSLFIDRSRPKGLECPACSQCNRNSSPHEHFVSLLASMKMSDPTPSKREKHIERLLRGLANNQPLLLAELEPTSSEDRRLRKEAREHGIEIGGGLNITGPLARKAIYSFGAKLAMALHWNETGAALPIGAKIYVRLYTNANAVRGEVPQALFDLLGVNGRTLKQGKWSVADQFQYRSGRVTDSISSCHWVTFGDSIMFYLFALEDIPPGRPEFDSGEVFMPGFLRN